MLWKTRIATALTIAATFAACSLDDLVPDGTLPIDDGASEGTKEVMKVDGSSEARLELKTGASLTVPKDAVDHSVMIAIERPADSKAVEFVESLKSVKAVASAPYVLTPHGTEFMKDLKLEIPVVANKGKELVAVYLKDESDREWKYLDTPTVENDVATVTLKHFSVIVLVDRERAGVEEKRDAGSASGQTDAGGDPVDAGAPADAGSATAGEDAGSVSVDAGSQGDPGGQTKDAGSASAHDAGTQTMTDAGQSAPDASASLDANVADAGSAPDGGTTLDASAQTPDAGQPDAYMDDSSAQTPPDTGALNDGSSQQPDACTPNAVCQEDWCGWHDDGCGGEMPCGECELYGGLCGFYEVGVCGFPVGT